MSSNSAPLSLTDIEDSVVEIGDDSSDPTEFDLVYLRETETVEHTGSPTEIGTIRNCSYKDLRPLADEGYTHYGFFREEDDTTVLLVQDDDGDTWKAFTNGPDMPEIAHLVTIT